MSQESVYTVSRLNADVRGALEMRWSKVIVEGELSNFSRPFSGHWYFTLKDEKAQIRCAMFRNRNSHVSFEPEDGMHILVTGQISLYEPRGDYQLIVSGMQHAGEGKLLLEFAKRKVALEQAGLFAQERKQPLPECIATIGVITSATGAAIHDVLSVLQRRSPWTRVILYPSPVQGHTAVDQLMTQIKTANVRNEVDVLLITRGGGSLEALWCFNDPDLVAAIAASNLPIVSAVGHEVDITLCDLAADLRAPTPSAGGEILSQSGSEMLKHYRHLAMALQKSMQPFLTRCQHRIALGEQRLLQYHPIRRLQQQQQKLDELSYRLLVHVKQKLERAEQQLYRLHSALMHVSPKQHVQDKHTRLDQHCRALMRSMTLYMQSVQKRADACAQQLDLVSPLSILQRGFSITKSETGQLITHSRQLQVGQKITTHLARGRMDAVVDQLWHDGT